MAGDRRQAPDGGRLIRWQLAAQSTVAGLLFASAVVQRNLAHFNPSFMAAAPSASDFWTSHLITTSRGIRGLLERTKRIAVLGIKTPESGQPAFYVADYTQQSGYTIVPVPVYYPDISSILGEPVYRRLVDIPGEVDMVNVFRRSGDIPPHVDDILAKRPKSVWMQLGIRNDPVAERLAREGIDVVQDKCLMVEIQRIGR